MRKRFLFPLAGIVLGFTLAVAVLVATPRGAGALLRIAAGRYLDAGQTAVRRVEGGLLGGAIFQGVEFGEIRGLPRGSVLRIQQLDYTLRGWGFRDSFVRVENARLDLPLSGPLVAFGTYRRGHLDANIFSPTLDVAEISGLFAGETVRPFRGTIEKIDLYLTGSPVNLRVKGTFLIDTLVRSFVYFSGVRGEADLTFKEAHGRYAPYGVVTLSGGEVKARRINVHLQSGRLRFDGNLLNPVFDIEADTQVGQTRIHIALQGTRQRPQIRMTSDPPLPEGQLMLMVFTGQPWSGLDTTLQDQRLNPDLAEDLLDYFLFGGRGSRIARKLGIKNVNLIYNQNERGIGVTKSLTGRLDVGYEIKQNTPAGQQATQTEQHLQGKVRLNRDFSLSVDKELLPQQGGLQSVQPVQKPDDKVFLEFKKSF